MDWQTSSICEVCKFPVEENNVNILQLSKLNAYLPICKTSFHTNGTFLCSRYAYIQLSSLSAGLFLCPGVVYQSEQVACSLSEFQPSPKWSGFKLQTFDFDSVSTLSLCGPAGPLSELEGHANLRQPWFWDQGESLLHCPQNKR